MTILEAGRPDHAARPARPFQADKDYGRGTIDAISGYAAPCAVTLRLPPLLRIFRFALALTVIIASATAGYLLSERKGLRLLDEQAGLRLDVLAAEVDGAIGSGASLPSAVALNEHVIASLRSDAGPAERGPTPANRYLESLNNHLGSLATFVLNRDGRVIAASDWMLSDNLLGADLSFQPFFRLALEGSRYGYYATDGTRNEPGFYFSQPILDETAGWAIKGVAVVKVSLTDLQRRWLGQDTPVLVADRNGVVILSTVPAWRYTLLAPDQAETILRSRKFDGRNLRAFPVTLDVTDGGSRVVRFPQPVDTWPGLADQRSYHVAGRQLYGTGWQMLVFHEVGSLHRQSLAIGSLAALLCSGALLLAGYLNQRRRLSRLRQEAQRLLQAANEALESKVAERTADLSAANQQLRDEIAERHKAEEGLRAAQDELVQAAKLAVIGRMAAGITHELNQPLGAIRTLSANASAFMTRGDLETAAGNLEIVGRQCEQMARIIGPLKSFARKSPARREAVDVGRVIDAAHFLFLQRFEQQHVSYDNQCPAGTQFARCDANRLEQVLVNLLSNALDALQGRTDGAIVLRARLSGPRLALTVADNGPGLPEQLLTHLFEPFYTTKEAGEGLGLGLTISRDIVRDFGGDLTGENAPEGGAVFTVWLPNTQKEGA